MNEQMVRITSMDLLRALEGLLKEVVDTKDSPFAEMATNRARQAVSKGKWVLK